LGTVAFGLRLPRFAGCGVAIGQLDCVTRGNRLPAPRQAGTCHGFYRLNIFPALLIILLTKGDRFQLAQHPLPTLPLSDAQMLFNCNTWLMILLL